MGEFDESYDCESVDTGDYSSDTSSEMDSYEDYGEDASCDMYEEDVSEDAYEEPAESETEYEEQPAEPEASDEYAEDQAESDMQADVENDEQPEEPEANDEYGEDQAESDTQTDVENDEQPAEPETDEGSVEDSVDESELSPAELRERGDQEVAELQENGFENMSDEELRAKYEEDTLQSHALQDAYSIYAEQIGKLSQEKNYYDDQDEWNSYVDEKISAQNDVVTRQYELKGEMNEMEREMDRRKDN